MVAFDAVPTPASATTAPGVPAPAAPAAPASETNSSGEQTAEAQQAVNNYVPGG